jgi:fatty acid/phospholipid biosynthesis enzyme
VIRVALDAMGADDGIEPLVAGAAQLSLEEAPIHTLLVGEPTASSRWMKSPPSRSIGTPTVPS